MTKACIDILGDGVLMHQSDYPHGEAYFPDTAGMECHLLHRWDRYLRQVLEHPVRCYQEGAILVSLANELCANGQTVGASEHRHRKSWGIHGRPDYAR